MTENKDKFSEEYDKLQNEIIRDRVKKAFAENPGNYREALEEIGFTWFDDDYPSEEEEEKTAAPQNDRQQLLVSCFEGKGEVSTTILDALTDERNADDPNYPLFRKYFRAANPRLKKLILFGLEIDPANLDLLSDLVFFNEFNRNLPEMIDYFTKGCRAAEDSNLFSEIAREFYYSTLADGYNALYALREFFAEESEKQQIINLLVDELNQQDQEDILF